MKALLYSDWDEVIVADVPPPVPREDEVLIRVEACGICASEIECVTQRSPRRTPPLILGHEFCGVIAEVGRNVSGRRVGDCVISCSVIPCGTCPPCRRGQTNLCAARRHFGLDRPGACAEFIAAPAAVVHPRPPGMDPVLGALVEPAANGIHVMQLLPGYPRATVFIFGAGVIGLMALQAAQALHNARVAVADLRPARLACAAALGAADTVNPDRADVAAAARAFSGADGPDYVVDAVGSAATKRLSLEIARPGGAICWLGLRENTLELSTYDITRAQKTVAGSYSCTAPEVLQAAALLSEGVIRGGPWVKTFPMDDAADAFRRMGEARGDDIKAVILP